MAQNDIKPVEILLVEDSPSDADLAVETFEVSNIRNNLHVVEDGVEALDFLYRRGKYAKAPRPELILLDLNLPKKSGLEVLGEIKSHPQLKVIPVVVLTTSASQDDIFKSYLLHANCYITKPVNFEQFSRVVRLIEDFWLAVVKLPIEG
ncbi:MAG: response regulator [Actinomycetota bacterium]